MAEDDQLEVPALPEAANSQGQQAATAPASESELAEGQLIVAPVDVLTESVRGLGSSGSSLTLTPTARAFLVAGLEMGAQSHLAALQDAAALRAETRKLQEQITNLQERIADLRVDLTSANSALTAERSNGTLRLIMSSIGAVVLSFIPFGYEKAQVAGAALCAVVGGLLVFAPWIHYLLFRSKEGKK